MDTVFIECGVAALIAAGGLVLHHLAFARELAGVRKEVSRFKLFEARDGLVMLAVTGRMKEDDEAWQTSYASVNWLLGMDRKLHALDCLRRYLHFTVLVSTNTAFQRKFKLMARKQKEAESRVPEYATVRQKIGEGFDHLVAARTTRLHLWIVMGVVLLLKLLGVAITARAGTTKLIRASLRDRSADKVSAWRSMERAY